MSQEKIVKVLAKRMPREQAAKIRELSDQGWELVAHTDLGCVNFRKGRKLAVVTPAGCVSTGIGRIFTRE